MRPSGATTTPEPEPPRVPPCSTVRGVGGTADGKADHGRPDPVDDVDHCARIGIEQRLVLGRDRKVDRLWRIGAPPKPASFKGIIFTEIRLIWPASAERSAGAVYMGIKRGQERATISAAVDSGDRVYSVRTRASFEGDFMVIANAARPAAALAIAAALLALAGCGQGQQQGSGPPPPTVTVAKPVQRTVVDQDEYVGRFVAVDSVEIRSRVSGYLAEIRFTDGQMVKKGDLLFVIDHKSVSDRARPDARQSRPGARQPRLRRS